MGDDTYGYAYDPIGNRMSATENTETTEYTANGLNQYSQISAPSVPSVVNPAYDLDGNMLTNGPWAYTWDAENRLVSACSNGVLLVTNVYDHRSRRVRKEVSVWDGQVEAYVPQSSAHYLWDGWNVVRETVAVGSGSTPSVATNYYTWGLDLSGSLQGAGGVGGLLAVLRNGTPYFPCYDANGNITEYVATNGASVARYEYSPFGETTAQSGDMADTFTHRFSTKQFDDETGLVMYELRPYEPDLGRWFSKDPIDEQGGLNLYGFAGNDPVNRWDYLGLAELEATLTIQDSELHDFGCSEWEEFSGQADADSYFGHFKKYTLGSWLTPKLANVPLKLPAIVVDHLASKMIAGLGMTRGNKEILWAVTIGTKFAYTKRYKKGDDCVRDVEFIGLAMRIERLNKGGTKVVVVYSGGYANPKKITATATVKVL